jgi:hypothetical protein
VLAKRTPVCVEFHDFLQVNTGAPTIWAKGLFSSQKNKAGALENLFAAAKSEIARQPLAVACAACFNLIVRGTGQLG